MPRSQFRSLPRRPAEFLNRIDEFRIICEHIGLLDADPSYLKVLEIVGLGGVGKTRLLSEFRQRLDSTDKRSQLIWVSLESEAAATAAGPLRVIRNQLGFDCLLFDSALLTYWTATGQPFQSVGGRGKGVSLAMRSAELGGALAGIPLPLTFAADLFAGLDRMAVRRRRYKRVEFEAIDELRDRPAELYARLPHYLGEDVQRRLDHTKRRFVFFYDAYEKQASNTVLEHAPWLREFIATLDAGIHLISTRDPLGWDEAEWGQVLQVLVLGALPEAECLKMVRDELGELDEDIEDRLVTASHRIPFFLQACIDVCRSQIEDHGVVRAVDLPSSPAASVEHLLDHLERPERMLAVVLACVQYFDEPLYTHLVRALNLPVTIVDIDEFVEWFFVNSAEHGLFKTHDLLTEAVRESTLYESVKIHALQSATEQLGLRSKPPSAEDPDRCLLLFHALVAAWQSTEPVPTPRPNS